jgi:hypothetical protein
MRTVMLGKALSCEADFKGTVEEFTNKGHSDDAEGASGLQCSA